MSKANVTSVDAVREFLAVVATFCDQASDALLAVDLESRRTLDWLAHEQRHHWENQIKIWREEAALAKNELNRRKLQRTQDNRVDIIEQEKAYRRALARLEEAETKLQHCKKWSIAIQHEISEYQAHARQLADRLEGDPAPPLAALHRIIESLESYLAVAPAPAGPRPSSAAAGAPASSTDSPRSEATEAPAEPAGPASADAPDVPAG